MMGPGSLNHNCRKFHAANTDPARSHLNIEYCNGNIEAVYHELFDEALKEYNEKQTRSDRRISDYYDKIRSGKQEKPFCELVIQIGSKDDCAAGTPDGERAAQILDQYMKAFQQRNPCLRVFSAHMHMDEATPHLHIDFVPYTTGSKRGLSTRVSLKKALESLGFKGGTRGDTEWNQWVNNEKECLAAIMQEHGIEWEHLGTHEEHLSVLDFKKQERSKEVAALEAEKGDLQEQVSEEQSRLELLLNTNTSARELVERTEQRAESAQEKLDELTKKVEKVEQYASEFTKPAGELLPEPTVLESAKSYRKRIMPLISKLLKLLKPLYAAYVELKSKYERLVKQYDFLEATHRTTQNLYEQTRVENAGLRDKADRYYRAREVLGEDMIDNAVQASRECERQLVRHKRIRQEL